MSTDREIFLPNPGFCHLCGSILPNLKEVGSVKCHTCKKEFPPEAFGQKEIKFAIDFSSIEALQKNKAQQEKDAGKQQEKAVGPCVDRECSKCGHDKMTYATLQLRSADEGQTVFYTCMKCNHQERENS